MTTKPDPRIVDLEARVKVIHSRLITLERLNGVAVELAEPVVAKPAPPASPTPVPAPPVPRRAATPRPARAARKPIDVPDLEDLLGGRVLAWVGGAAVVLGLAFFFALAVSRGWIGEGARCLFGAGAASALLAAGVWLREKRSRNEGAMAAAATGLAGLFLVVVVATQVYELIDPLAGIGLAMVVGGCAVALALRWNAPVIGAIGTIGSVLAPALAGADADATTIALLGMATAAGSVVLVHKRWNLIGVGLFVTATPQWVPWVVGDASATAALITLVGFGVAGVAAAVGFELRSGNAELRKSSAFLMTTNSLVLALAGWAAFGLSDHAEYSKLWLAALAVTHVAVGAGMRAERRISPALRTLALGIGVVLADVAWSTIADGPAVGAGWSLSAIGFAFAMSRRSLGDVERKGAMLGLGGQISIALLHTLAVDAPLQHVSGATSADAIMVVATLAAACLLSARFAEDGNNDLRVLLDGVGLAALAYLTAISLDGVTLVVAFAVQACAFAAIARARKDAVAGYGALSFLGIAAGHVLVIEAPPKAFLYGAHEPLWMLAAIVAVSLAALRVADVAGVAYVWQLRTRVAAAVALLYGASVAIVSAFQPGGEQSSMLEIGVRQEGQMLVSGLWSLSGVAALIIGLQRGNRDLRLAGLGVLIASVAKVFLFDLATLTSIYRVASFIALGLLLLAGSYAWQRSRPAPLPDLRNA